MHDHPIDRLPALLLGDDDDPAVADHVASCGECSDELAMLRELIGRLAVALPRGAPPRSVRQRLFGSVARLERFASFAPALGSLFELAPDDARRCLHALSDAERWQLGAVPGVAFLPVRVEPHATAMFVRFDAGAAFPLHRHVGDERVLVLDGELFEPSVVRVGETVARASGTTHAVSAHPEKGCVCAVVNEGHVELLS